MIPQCDRKFIDGQCKSKAKFRLLWDDYDPQLRKYVDRERNLCAKHKWMIREAERKGKILERY